MRKVTVTIKIEADGAVDTFERSEGGCYDRDVAIGEAMGKALAAAKKTIDGAYPIHAVLVWAAEHLGGNGYDNQVELAKSALVAAYEDDYQGSDQPNWLTEAATKAIEEVEQRRRNGTPTIFSK